MIFHYIQGATGSSDTGPAAAYSGSYYMYIETSSPTVQGDWARMTSDVYFNSKAYNLSVAVTLPSSAVYYMYIETSSPTVQGDWARMTSDVYFNSKIKSISLFTFIYSLASKDQIYFKMSTVLRYS